VSCFRSRSRAETGSAAGMKLLFDQNLSPRLPRFLADFYEGSVHVSEVGLRDASDVAVWEYAKQHGFAIVSKDSDFQARSLLYGCPPNSSGYESGIALFERSRICCESILPLFTLSEQIPKYRI